MYASMPPPKIALEGRKVTYPGGRVRGEKGGGNSGFMPSPKIAEETVFSSFRERKKMHRITSKEISTCK